MYVYIYIYIYIHAGGYKCHEVLKNVFFDVSVSACIHIHKWYSTGVGGFYERKCHEVLKNVFSNVCMYMYTYLCILQVLVACMSASAMKF